MKTLAWALLLIPLSGVAAPSPEMSALPPIGVVRAFMVPGTRVPLYCWRVGEFEANEHIWPSMCVPQTYIRTCVESKLMFHCPNSEEGENE